MNKMTIYRAVLLLVREAMSGEPADFKEYNQNSRFWEKVFIELQNQTVLGITADTALLHNEIPENIKKEWVNRKKQCVADYCYMAVKQREVCDILQEAGIPVAVMKGMAAAIYYPVPETRTVGDIDLIVMPRDYYMAIELLKDNGYKVREGHNSYHTRLTKGGIVIELHRSPGGITDKINGKNVRKYILSGLGHIEEKQVGPFRFPILPVQQNGMELIWHVRQHLYNGLGLRQILDWMMYVDKNLDDEQYQEYRKDLEECGLNDLAVHVTRMCQKYLGLQKDTFTWCRYADEKVCDDLMMFIMDQGNFGHKKNNDDKMAKVLSGYPTIFMLFEKIQKTGEKEWEPVQKYPILKSFAWIYEVRKIVESYILKRRNLLKTLRNLRTARLRKRMFKKLYKVTSTKAEIKNRVLRKQAQVHHVRKKCAE